MCRCDIFGLCWLPFSPHLSKMDTQRIDETIEKVVEEMRITYTLSLHNTCDHWDRYFAACSLGWKYSDDYLLYVICVLQITGSTAGWLQNKYNRKCNNYIMARVRQKRRSAEHRRSRLKTGAYIPSIYTWCTSDLQCILYTNMEYHKNFITLWTGYRSHSNHGYYT